MSEIEKEISPVKASVSVPVKEQAQFMENKTRLLTLLAAANRQMSFSNIVRIMVNGATIEDRDGVPYLVVKL